MCDDCSNEIKCCICKKKLCKKYTKKVCKFNKGYIENNKIFCEKCRLEQCKS